VRVPAPDEHRLIPPAARTTHEISAARDAIRYIAISRDRRRIFIARGAEQADTWMAQLE